MNLQGITGQNRYSGEKKVNIDKLDSNISNVNLKEKTLNNNLDDIVIKNEKGIFRLYSDELNVKGGFPSVGSNIDFGDIKGEVIISDNENVEGYNERISKLNIKPVIDNRTTLEKFGDKIENTFNNILSKIIPFSAIP